MKRLTLIRHAKSSWATSGISDFERSLNERGSINAPLMGKKLLEKGIQWDQVLSSSANRTQMTIEAIAEVYNNTFPIEYSMDLYCASDRDLMSQVQSCKDAWNSVAIVAHNPGITVLVYLLTEEMLSNVATCGVVQIEFDVENWSQIRKGSGKFISYDCPRDYESEWKDLLK